LEGLGNAHFSVRVAVPERIHGDKPFGVNRLEYTLREQRKFFENNKSLEEKRKDDVTAFESWWTDGGSAGPVHWEYLVASAEKKVSDYHRRQERGEMAL